MENGETGPNVGPFLSIISVLSYQFAVYRSLNIWHLVFFPFSLRQWAQHSLVSIINNEWYLVDLPGYGYAKNSKTVRNKLEQMIAQYILQRKQLVNVFVLIDIRHEQQKIDREFVDWLGESNVPFSIIFTKADKLSPAKAKSNALLWMKKLQDRWEVLPPYFITSSEDKTGRDEVLDYIDQINATLE